MNKRTSEKAILLWASPLTSHSTSSGHAESGDQGCPGGRAESPQFADGQRYSQTVGLRRQV